MHRAHVTSTTRGSDGVELLEVPAPRPGAGEAVVAMAFAPINPADLLLVHGRHVYQPALPSPIGIEGAGVIAEVGDGVAGDLVGRKVAVPFGGTWTPRLALAADALLVLPGDVDLAQAAMLSVNPFTAWGLLDGLAPGDVVVQNAAASAVGRLVIRLARRRGVRTVNVVRREAQVAELRALGADHVLVGDHDLAARVRAEVGAAPVVRGLDAVAGEATGALFAALAEGATLLVYGLLADDRAVLPAAPLVFRDVTVRGYSRLRVMRALPPARRAAMTDELLAAARQGDLDAAIEARFPLARLREALAAHERPGRAGKILLELGG